MPPVLMTPPKIERPARRGGSKYINEADIETAAAMVTKGWVGGLIEPVDTLIKARIAAKAWKNKLAEYMEKPTEAYAVRVFTPEDDKGKPIKDKFTFAIVLKKGA